MTGVLIRGDGIAARCAAHLLSRAGFEVSLEAVRRPRVPCILLSQAAQELIRDVFGDDALFRDAPQIRTRIVQWGADANTVTLPHLAVVVSEESLLAALPAVQTTPADPSWTIITTPSQTTMQCFGGRMASIRPVETAEAGSCRIESLDAGWRFLISGADGAGWLIAVGESAGEFPVAPRIASPMCGPGWLACGSAALAFDPLCGDGTAHAVREAILAAAVIRAVEQGEPIDDVLLHYEARLTAGFQRHLLLCREYYATGGSGPWWQEQRDELERGLKWCAARLPGGAPFRYQLKDYELQATAPGASPRMRPG